MQTLGLADSTPRTESRWRALFWPTIRNDGDFDYVTRQGFWVCCIVAAVTFVFNAFTGSPIGGAVDAMFYYLAGVGVRERSRTAAVAAFLTYLLSGVLLQFNMGAGGGVVRIIFLALLFANVRGNWLSARWEKDSQEPVASMRLSETLADKFADQLPPLLWPKGRFIFYGLAVLEIAGLLIALFTLRA